MGKALQLLKDKIKALQSRGFVRSVGVLAGGTAFAQGLTLLALPVVTRLYTPDDFSVLAVYVPILAMVAVIACMRLEIAISLPEKDADAVNLLALALVFSAVVSLVFGAVLWLSADSFIDMVGQPALAPYLWLLPLGVWCVSSYAALQYWCSRKKKFEIIARTRMTQALGGIGTQIGFGAVGIAPFGLLLGHMVNSGAGVFGLSRPIIRDSSHVLRQISWASMRRQLRKYDRFPKYSTFEALLNNAGVQLPVVIIAAVAIGPEAGYLMLATRVMAAPVGLIGGAVAQVYLSQAPTELRAGNLANFTLGIIGGLVKTGVGPLLFIGIVAPQVFPIVFGAEWARAGELVAWLTPWFVVQFLSSPVSMSLHVCGRQRTALVLQIVGFCIRVGAVVVAATIFQTHLIEIYAVSGLIFYILYVLVISSILHIALKQLCKSILVQAKILVPWVLAGLGSTWIGSVMTL